tara:strand:- start:491 stop:709 length:219 start_codon:yes stop_codon:yes gene_type:complete
MAIPELERYPDNTIDEKVWKKSHIGGVHRPRWIVKHALNARWKNGVGNTEFWNREARRHLIYVPVEKEELPE